MRFRELIPVRKIDVTKQPNFNFLFSVTSSINGSIVDLVNFKPEYRIERRGVAPLLTGVAGGNVLSNCSGLRYGPNDTRLAAEGVEGIISSTFSPSSISVLHSITFPFSSVSTTSALIISFSVCGVPSFEK